MSAVPESVPMRMISGLGLSLIQLSIAFLWMIPVCPTKALGRAKIEI
jgi:hypothetical protein